MSTVPAERNSRRKSEDVRRHALEIGRRLLSEGGLGALTLKAVGAAMNMSHANLIHHFGSAEAFQLDLKTSMVDELTRAVTALVARGEPADAGSMVDLVFDAYASGGIGTLMAWSALMQTTDKERPLFAICDLIHVLEHQIEGRARSQRARAMICLVTSLALADSLIGEGLSEIAGGDRRVMRELTVDLLHRLSVNPDAIARTAGAAPAPGP